MSHTKIFMKQKSKSANTVITRYAQPAIAGAGPVAEAGIVQVEMDVGRPDTVAARCFGTKLGRNCDLVDFLRGRDEVRDNIFHKPLGEPDNACVHPLRMNVISPAKSTEPFFIGTVLFYHPNFSQTQNAASRPPPTPL